MAFPFLLAAAAVTAGSQYMSAKQNQRNMENEAAYATQRAALEEDRFRRDAKRLIGRQTAVGNKANRPLTQGSMADLLAEQVGENALDALIIRYGGQIQSRRASDAAKQYGTRAIMGPLSTLLTAGASGAFSQNISTVGNLSGGSYVGDINSPSYLGGYS